MAEPGLRSGLWTLRWVGSEVLAPAGALKVIITPAGNQAAGPRESAVPEHLLFHPPYSVVCEDFWKAVLECAA